MIAEAKPIEFFESINPDALDDNTAAAMFMFMDQPEFKQANEFGDTPEFVKLKEFILAEFPNAIKGYEETIIEQPIIEEVAELPVAEEPKIVDTATKISTLKGRSALIAKMIAKGKIEKSIGESRLKLIGKMLGKLQFTIDNEEKAKATITETEPFAELKPELLHSDPLPDAIVDKELPVSDNLISEPKDDDGSIELIQKESKKLAEAYIEEAKKTNPNTKFIIEPTAHKRWVVKMLYSTDGGIEAQEYAKGGKLAPNLKTDAVKLIVLTRTNPLSVQVKALVGSKKIDTVQDKIMEHPGDFVAIDKISNQAFICIRNDRANTASFADIVKEATQVAKKYGFKKVNAYPYTRFLSAKYRK